MSTPIKQSAYDKAIASLQEKFPNPLHAATAIEAFNEGDTWEVLPDNHATFRPYAAPAAPAPRPVVSAADPAVTERTLAIRASQPGISIEKAQRQALQDVAFGRGETPAVTMADLNDMTSAEMQDYMQTLDPSIMTDHVAADPIADALDALAPDERAAWNVANGLTDAEVARVGAPDWDPTVKSEAVQREKAVQAKVSQNLDIQFKAQVDMGYDEATARANAESFRPSIEYQARKQAGVVTESQELQDTMRALPRSAMGLTDPDEA